VRTTLSVVAKTEITHALRERSSHLLVGIFSAMVVVSAAIGFQTHRTVTRIHESLVQHGLTVAANPFADVSPLYYARNSVIYVVMIGSLMAIVLGVESTLRDRRAGVVSLILSRPSAFTHVLRGKLMGIGLVLAAVLLLSMALSWTMLSAIVGSPLGLEETLRLGVFGMLSWVLLLGFAGVGMMFGTRSRHESTAYVAPFVAWSVIAFVLPQMGTAARPISLLNPVPTPAGGGSLASWLSYIVHPLSVTEQFKTVSGFLLQEPYVSGDVAGGVASVVVFALLMTVLSTRSRRKTITEELDA